MSNILSDIELARIRQKLKEELGRDLTVEESRLLKLSKTVIKPGPEPREPEQLKDKAATGQAEDQDR
jgi:hypothetical protein